MIRIIREGSHKYPWLLKGIMLVIAVTFIVGMGWFGFEASQPNTVAEVGPYKIAKQDYLRSKQLVYERYRDQLQNEEIQEETLDQIALERIVIQKSWQVLAEELNLAVSGKELHDTIVNQPEFQKDGVFDSQYYQRLLARIRMTPNQYERQQRDLLLAAKANLLVTEATTLTPAELQEVTELHTRQTLDGAEPDPEVFEQIKMQFLIQKKQRALQAFQTNLRARGNITIHEGLL